MARGKKNSAKKKGVSKPVAAPIKSNQPIKSETPKKSRSKLFKRTPKSERPSREKLIGAPKLFAQSLRILAKNWKLFTIILVIYALLYIVLVGGLSGKNLTAVKSGLLSVHASNSTLTTTLFSNLLSSGGSGNTVAGVYQTFLLIIISLVIIWAIRNSIDGQKIRARDAFYKGTYPLIPFLLVILVIGLELLPLIFGGALYNAVISSSVAKGPIQVGLVIVILATTISLSMYWIASSVIALYVSTNPDTAPMQALRHARDLVRFRRIEVLRKLLFLPFVLFVTSVLILMPVARYATSAATAVFFGLSVVMMAIVHSYVYSLYRELE